MNDFRFYLVLGLQLKLVAQGELEHAVLGRSVRSVYDLGQAPVVASIQLEVGELIGNTHGDGEVERLGIKLGFNGCLAAFHLTFAININIL